MVSYVAVNTSMYQQRFVTGGIIAILVLLILVVLYSKIRG